MTQITTGTGEGTRQKVLNAALTRGDLVAQMRMLAHPDLFAFDAKYHRSCYAKYISARNVSAGKRKADNSRQQFLDDPAFSDLVQQIRKTILSS